MSEPQRDSVPEASKAASAGAPTHGGSGAAQATHTHPGWPAGSRLLSIGQFVLAILVTAGVLAYLLWPATPPAEEAGETVPAVEVVKLVGEHRLAIAPGTPLEKKLVVGTVAQQETRAPRLKVTGSVVARLPPGKEHSPPPAQLLGEPAIAEGRWDFNSPEVASAYADWLKARADVPFYEKQYGDIQKLAVETLKAKKDVFERLEKLVKAGTDPEKDLAAAKADYLQAKAQSQKDEHEAQTNINNAKRTLGTLERQLFAAGVDPELLASTTASTAIVVAEVPEDRVGLVERGQPCTAHFYAFPDESIPGVVRSLAPTITKDRRTLRVFFQIDDPRGRMKPGMFAEIGLGTNPRETILVPADAVLHVGQFDYVLVGAQGNEWRITRIRSGEQYGKHIEVLEGLKPGDRLIGEGAILLKPYLVQDMQAAADVADAPLYPGTGQGKKAVDTAKPGSAAPPRATPTLRPSGERKEGPSLYSGSAAR